MIRSRAMLRRAGHCRRRGLAVAGAVAAAAAAAALVAVRAPLATSAFCAGALCSGARPSATVERAGSAGRSATKGTSTGIGFVHDVVGEYQLPKPWFYSPCNGSELYTALGVAVRSSEANDDGVYQHLVAPQPPQLYRPHNAVDEGSLRDMSGEAVGADRNPGVRVEREIVSEEEEAQILRELKDLAAEFGYDFASPGEEITQLSWRITGRDEGRSELPLAPWSWGTDFDKSKLPEGLGKVVSKLEQLSGYALGPIRDVTVNIRQSVDYQMSPHIDPPADGPNSFVLSLASGAVVTFSPVKSLREDPERANDDEIFIQHSYSDDDIDCLVPRRSIYHFSGNARYLWTHAIRPPAAREGDEGLETYERWGTWDKVLRRRSERAAIIFTFADLPPAQQEAGARADVAEAATAA